MTEFYLGCEDNSSTPALPYNGLSAGPKLSETTIVPGFAERQQKRNPLMTKYAIEDETRKNKEENNEPRKNI